MRPAIQRCFHHLPTVVAALALALTASAARARRTTDGAPSPKTCPCSRRDRSPSTPGLVLALPASLPTGLSSGLGAGVTRGRRFAWGVRGSWSSATESSLVWTVSHDDFRLRGVAALQQPAGRGVFALRLGLGPTFVHEQRTRNQGARAGLTGSDLESSALAVFPAADLEAVVTLHIVGRWSLVLAGGPTAIVADGALRAGGPRSSARGGSREASVGRQRLLSRATAARRGVRGAEGVRR